MLKTILLFLFSLNLAHAGRFEEAERKEFIAEVKQEIAEHKLENKGIVDLQIIKPEFYLGLDELHEEEKATKEEILVIKQRFENLSKDRSVTAQNAESAFYSFLETQLADLDKKPLLKTKEGEICNNWSCEKELTCAPDPVQEYGNKCRKTEMECKVDEDCCSNECVENPRTKKKSCEDVYRCFRPLKENQSCKANPVCATGSCLPYNALTAGIGECEADLKACRKNSDCCSNLCSAGVCKENYICKDCTPLGKRSERGKKCCEGLYLNENGVCVPDVPPSVIPQVRFAPLRSILMAALNFFVAPAEAGTLVNIVAASNEDCERSITQTFPDKTGTCTLGGGCGVSCGKPSSTCQSANPSMYGVCTDGSELSYIEGRAPKTDEEVAQEDDSFLATGNATADSADIVATIKGDKDKYGAGFQARSGSFVANEKEIGALKVTRQSNFETCEMKFKDDFMAYLEKNELLELEMALLGFDFVFSGDGVNDYWTGGGGSIYARLKEASRISKEQRQKLWETIETTNKELTCMCLDAQGLNNIRLDAKKEFFRNECPEYAKYTVEGTHQDELDGDASGLKAKRLLVTWTSKLASFNRSLVVDHGKVKDKVSAVLDWMGDDQKWSETRTKTHTLFNFNIKNPRGSAAALGAIIGALLAAGVIAIMGGFGTASILSAWGAAGIISASAVSGAGGLWMISSLRGAWITKKPEIFDRYVRTYGCGKKETCVEYSRELIQPFNDVCNVNTSANACVKDFLVIRESGQKEGSSATSEESIFLVDPWVPYNVAKSLVIKDSINGETYAEKLDRGFVEAKAAMIAKNPKNSAGGKGGAYVPESYLSEVFLDPELVGKYVPQLGSNLEEKYFLRGAQIKEIKKDAIEFALEQKFFESEDLDNLNIFAEYAYHYHFVYPKRSRLNEISYPAVGLKNYVNIIANEVIGTLAANAVNAAGDADSGFTNLNLRYLEDYYNTLDLYEDALNQTDAVRRAAIRREMDAVGAEIERLKTLSALVANPALDSAEAFNKALYDQSRLSGGKAIASLTDQDRAFLNSVGKLRSDRKAQLKKYETYKKAVAASGNKERAEKMAKAVTKFNAKFTKPISNGSKFGSNLAETVVSAIEKNAKTDSSAGKLFGGGAGGGGSYSSVAPDSSGLYGVDGVAGSSGIGSSKGAGGPDGRSKSGGRGSSDDDRRRLAEAIEARNKANKDKYKSDDGQTLFEKVTNAYIRNYDRVLSKKKDKDVIESK